MLGLVIKSSTALIVIFFVLSAVTRVSGEIQPTNPALRGFVTGCEAKPELCWYGIVPGITTVEEASQILLDKGFTERQLGIEISGAGYKSFIPVDATLACEFELYFFEHSIQQMALSTCGKVRFGDLTGILGVPQQITGLGIVLYKNAGLWVELPLVDRKRCVNLNPSSTISSIRLLPQETIEQNYRFFQHEPKIDWKGLLTFSDYMRLYGLTCRAF